MIVYSLTGESGTGKSTSALQFAYQHQIDGIIDDGILIVEGKKVAGVSAKFEQNTIKAIRRAIFYYEDHKKEVMEAIKAYDLQSILIIGTSDKMTKRIAERLELGKIKYFYYIEDIRSKKEIQIAKFVRSTQGHHVMPIPYKQVEQNVFKRLIRKGKDIFTKNRVKLGETTIVRPNFHREVVHISRSVYLDIIRYSLKSFETYLKVDSINFDIKDHHIVIDIACYLRYPVNDSIRDKLTEVQRRIIKEFIQCFEFEPEAINIRVKGIILKE